jgi:hypothetical protein
MRAFLLHGVSLMIDVPALDLTRGITKDGRTSVTEGRGEQYRRISVDSAPGIWRTLTESRLSRRSRMMRPDVTQDRVRHQRTIGNGHPANPFRDVTGALEGEKRPLKRNFARTHPIPNFIDPTGTRARSTC